MYISSQMSEFLQFVFIGIIIAIIFDFFRAYRKFKKVSDLMVVIQDILFFLISGIIIMIGIINLLDSNIRLYTFFAIIIGILIYISLFSEFFLKVYSLIFKVYKYIIDFFILPITINIQIFIKIYTFFEKNIKKCCKMFPYMLFLIKKQLKIKKGS
jgi:spore cortex biosynthesis protein YabQ